MGYREPEKEKLHIPLVYIGFGLQGHETEYVLRVQQSKYSEAQTLPAEWESNLTRLLGEGWSVMNRGERIEIGPPNSERTNETDSKLREAIRNSVGNDFEVVEKG